MKEVNQVKNSLMEINNRVNFSGLGLGSVLSLVILVIISRAIHHFMVKRPGKVLKCVRRNEFEARIDKLEAILKAMEYFSHIIVSNGSTMDKQ